MIYFDNAATSYPKPDCVIDAVHECLKSYCGNPGRSSHALAARAAEEIYYTRECVADFFGIKEPERVIFTHNATDALNIAIKTTVRENSNVITSDVEHNATVRPLFKLSRTNNVTISRFKSELNTETEILGLAQADTSCIVSTLCSNVTGKRIDIDALSKASKKLGIPLILDASQAAGHFLIDFPKTPFDVLCAPAHKALFGIQGAGILIFTDNLKRDSFIEGGSGSESINPDMPEGLPERFEAGTQAVPSIIALRQGIEFIKSVGLVEITKKLHVLTEYAIERLESLQKLTVISEGDGIISFYVSDVPSSEISARLDKYKICTRSGLHCAPIAHEKLGTQKNGMVRISFSWFNSLREIDFFYKVMRELNDYYF